MEKTRKGFLEWDPKREEQQGQRKRKTKRFERRKERTRGWQRQRKRESKTDKHNELVVKAFWALCRGMNIDDWRWLMDIDHMLQKVYIFNYMCRSARHPDLGQLPWPVIHLLACRSRKHIYIPSNLPSVESYIKQTSILDIESGTLAKPRNPQRKKRNGGNKPNQSTVKGGLSRMNVRNRARSPSALN